MELLLKIIGIFVLLALLYFYCHLEVEGDIRYIEAVTKEKDICEEEKCDT